MRAIVLSAESNRQSLGALTAGKAFDRKALLMEFRAAPDFRQTRLFKTIPVVAAWTAIQKVADEQGYVFRVPSFHPRNPRNAPTPAEAQILDELSRSRSPDYFSVNPASNEMIYARPVTLTQDCMECHGSPSLANKEGKDLVGFPMEGWHPGEMHGAFVLHASMSHIDGEVRAGLLYSALWMTPIAIILGIFAFLAVRPVSRGLANTVHVLEEISKGNLTQHFETVIGNDEVGDMDLAMRGMSAHLRQMVGEIAESVGALFSTSTDLAVDSGNFSSGSSEVSEKAHTLSGSSSVVAGNIQSVAAAMEQTATNLNCLASNTENMTATIGEIASSSEKVRVFTNTATQQAKQISEQMSLLDEAAQKIGQITETINEISAQTNLLALNATIEAARAGSSGKGFAVVATEIKALAQQTAAATHDIRQRIAGVQSFAGSGAGAIREISGVIGEVTDMVSSIAAAIEEQATVTKDISRNISEASIGVTDANRQVLESSLVTREIAGAIAEVDQAAGNMALGGKHVDASSARISTIAGKLRSSVERFQI